MQLIRKKETDQFNIYENMPDQELFLMIRDDLLHSRTGIRLEEILEKNDREKFRKEVKDYIRRIYRISEAKMQRFVTYIEHYIFKFHVLTAVMEDGLRADIDHIIIGEYPSGRGSYNQERYCACSSHVSCI